MHAINGGQWAIEIRPSPRQGTRPRWCRVGRPGGFDEKLDALGGLFREIRGGPQGPNAEEGTSFRLWLQDRSTALRRLIGVYDSRRGEYEASLIDVLAALVREAEGLRDILGDAPVLSERLGPLILECPRGAHVPIALVDIARDRDLPEGSVVAMHVPTTPPRLHARSRFATEEQLRFLHRIGTGDALLDSWPIPRNPALEVPSRLPGACLSWLELFDLKLFIYAWMRGDYSVLDAPITTSLDDLPVSAEPLRNPRSRRRGPAAVVDAAAAVGMAPSQTLAAVAAMTALDVFSAVELDWPPLDEDPRDAVAVPRVPMDFQTTIASGPFERAPFTYFHDATRATKYWASRAKAQ